MVAFQKTLELQTLPQVFTAQTFPKEFLASKVLACVQLGIPLKPGVPATAFEADSFKLLAFVVHGRIPDTTTYFSKADRRGPFAGYCKTLVCNYQVENADLVTFMRH